MRAVQYLHQLAGCDAQTWGTKACTLAQLSAAGFNVPPGVVLAAEGSQLLPAEVDAVLRLVAGLGEGPFAVRSSSTAEDQSDEAAAGRYTTVLNVQGEAAVGSAVHQCLNSMDASPMGVLIQRQIPATAAGVAFSVNPVNGRDGEAVVNAVRGLGDKLVSGEVTPDHWIVTSSGARVPDPEQTAITASEAKLVAALAQEVARERGAPQDIEWAFAGEQLFLLQARPITTLIKPIPTPVVVPPGFWQREASHSPSPRTPMTRSVMDENPGLRALAERLGLLMTLQGAEIGGWHYVGMHFLGRAPSNRKPPRLPAWALPVLLALVPSGRRCIRAARRLFEEDLSMQILDHWYAEDLPGLQLRIAQLRDTDLAGLSDESLMGHLRKAKKLLEDGLPVHFMASAPQFLETTRLEILCRNLLGWDYNQVMELLSGTSVMSSEPARELERLSRQPPDVGPQEQSLAEYRRVYGARALAMETAEPTFAEMPGLIASQLDSLHGIDQDVVAAASEAARYNVAERARAQLSGQALAAFNIALERALKAYPVREHNVFYALDSPLALVRYGVLEAGRRAVRTGALASVDDVFFCTFDEVLDYFDGRTEDLRSLARRRRGEHMWFLAHPGPATYGSAPSEPPSLRWLPKPLRELTEILLLTGEHVFAPAMSERSEPEQPGNLQGVAASAGKYTGVVRVVTAEAEFGKIQPGDVLVCPATRPSWSVVFASLGAIVTDSGGALSHPAIIAREHRIPAVVATGCATKILHDGDIVTVDGSGGVVLLPIRR